MVSIQRLSTLDIRNAISHIREKENTLLAACEAHENASSMNSEIALVMCASDCEIEMSNFAQSLREKLSAGVIN